MKNRLLPTSCISNGGACGLRKKWRENGNNFIDKLRDSGILVMEVFLERMLCSVTFFFIPGAASGGCCPGLCTRNHSAFARSIRQAHFAHSGARTARILRTESFRCWCGQSCAPVGARTVLFIN